MDGSLGEAITRATLIEAFPDQQIVKTRSPLWLEGLELDCYCEELRFAVEYQGVQHYRFEPFFHNNDPENFKAQQERDDRKRHATFTAWVTLIEVPHTVPFKQIRELVRHELLELGYELAPIELPDIAFIAQVREDGTLAKTMLEKARNIAESHGGRCLSETYIECHQPLVFECKEGHRFETGLASVNAIDHKRPRFCPECGGTRKRTEDENRELVESAGYELLHIHTTRTGGDQRTQQTLHVQCPNREHESYDVLRSNFMPVIDGKPHRGCVKCSSKKEQHMRGELARAKRISEFGLEALDPYATRKVKTRWRCIANGHEFTASWNTINLRKRSKCLEC